MFTAGSAEDAVRLAEAERPNMLVPDIGMPDVDGFDTSLTSSSHGQRPYRQSSRRLNHRIRALRRPNPVRCWADLPFTSPNRWNLPVSCATVSV